MYTHYIDDRQPAALMLIHHDGHVERRLFTYRYQARMALSLIPRFQEEGDDYALSIKSATLAPCLWTWN